MIFECTVPGIVNDKENRIHSWVNLTPDEVFVSGMTWAQVHSVDITREHGSLGKLVNKRVRVTIEILDT